MDEHKNSEEVEGRKILKPWADKHGIVKHSDLVDQLLEASTNSRNLPEEENWLDKENSKTINLCGNSFILLISCINLY